MLENEIDNLNKDQIKETFNQMVDFADIGELRAILNMAGHKGLLNKVEFAKKKVKSNVHLTALMEA